MKEIELYTTENGKCPFIEWIRKLDTTYKLRINKRIDRMRNGNFGDCKSLQNSPLSELRFNFGKGYRVYFKELDNVIILNKVIEQANQYYEDFLKRSTKL